MTSANPLLERSHLPYQLPDFAALTAPHHREAFEAGTARQRAALDALASDTEPATVENVLHAWDTSGDLLARLQMAFYAVRAADTTPELDALHTEFAPRLAQHSDAIWLDRRLFDRFTELATRAQAGEVTLDAEDAWLLEDTIRRFTRAGVALGEEDQARLRALNTRLAELGAAFQRANREARVAGRVVVTDRAELAGLTDAEVDALATGDGEWTIELVNTTQQPITAKLHDRTLRRRVFEASIARGLGGEHDTRQIIVDIARTRAERAQLLGYEHHAALVAESGCARSTDAVNALMGPLGRAALKQAETDAATFAERFAELTAAEPVEAQGAPSTGSGTGFAPGAGADVGELGRTADHELREL